MTWAHIESGTIDQTGPLPDTYWDGTRWWDLRTGQANPTDAGWVEVVETTRPADTDTQTSDQAITLVVGVPTRVWTVRDWTSDEIAARAEAAAIMTPDAVVSLLLAKRYPPPADPTSTDGVDTWDDLGGIWPPGGLVLDAGTVYRNVSGTVLTTAPTAFPGVPGQWVTLFVPVTIGGGGSTAPAWSADATYSVGDLVSDGGSTWSCLIAHGPERQGTWEPNAQTAAAGVWALVSTP